MPTYEWHLARTDRLAPPPLCGAEMVIPAYGDTGPGTMCVECAVCSATTPYPKPTLWERVLVLFGLRVPPGRGWRKYEPVFGTPDGEDYFDA